MSEWIECDVCEGFVEDDTWEFSKHFPGKVICDECDSDDLGEQRLAGLSLLD